ncbi:acetate kinase [Buchnera aphidicola]|uniref:Acetate kinase n=1 Tax=Buchnera aphidicola (Aphis gossypii) TaxID=98785 RepID=A0A5J6ZCY5_9GAMM|nr:acetate kinase [Buchnera aphidicola]QFQ32021.1 acetate kinase [Buchnera aphidicola (Aphis gossypii)]
MLNNLIFVLNCGSSSIKFSILNPQTKKKYLSGLVECLFLEKTYIKWKYLGVKYKKYIGAYISHENALNFIFNQVLFKKQDIYNSIIGIGHRVVHGGNKINQSVLINDEIINCIKESAHFAPLHNPLNLIGIKIAIEKFPALSKKNVAVFDTSFYHKMPKTSFLYAIPYVFYKKYHIRRYGAHGISHDYVSHEASVMLNKNFTSLNIITCHLGNGCSVSAIRNGVCVDTSMGLTPLEGLVMGTRSGDIDPSIIFFMNQKIGISIEKINTILNKESGLLGLSEKSSDFRYLEKNYSTNELVKLSVDIFCHRLSKYIASYICLMDNCLDAVVFTGGIGENVSLIRQITVSKLHLMGLEIDIKKNFLIKNGKSGSIAIKNSIPVLVIPTDEELLIAKKTMKIISSM